MTYTNSLEFAWDQTPDSIDNFNWPKGSEGFCLTGILHLLASCDRIAGWEEMGASVQAFHTLLCKLDTTKCFGDSLFISYEPSCYWPTVNHSLDRSSIYILTFIQNLVRLTVKNIRISSKLSIVSGFPLQVREPSCSNKMSSPVLYNFKYLLMLDTLGTDQTVFRYW